MAPRPPISAWPRFVVFLASFGFIPTGDTRGNRFAGVLVAAFVAVGLLALCDTVLSEQPQQQPPDYSTIGQ